MKSLLDEDVTLEAADLRTGDCSTLQIGAVQLASNRNNMFEDIMCDGSVVKWGDVHHGGDSSAVQDQLKNVQQIQASYEAFAAVRADGSVITWGNLQFGGISSAVQDKLKNVQHIPSSPGTFATILGDGSVVCWGATTFLRVSAVVQASRMA